MMEAPRTRVATKLLRAFILAVLLLGAAAAEAASPQQQSTMKSGVAVRGSSESEETLGPLSTSEKQGYGCLVAGAAGLGLTALAGGSDVVLLFTGATTLPSANPVGLALAVGGTVVASTCAVGALLAPTALRLWHYYYDRAKIVAEAPR